MKEEEKIIICNLTGQACRSIPNNSHCEKEQIILPNLCRYMQGDPGESLQIGGNAVIKSKLDKFNTNS